jgi:hypothetical protein
MRHATRGLFESLKCIAPMTVGGRSDSLRVQPGGSRRRRTKYTMCYMTRVSH